MMGHEVWIDYTNHRGERATRRILPMLLRFMKSEWHPEEQWVILARDCERGVFRDFAVKDIHSWKVAGVGVEEEDGSCTAMPPYYGQEL